MSTNKKKPGTTNTEHRKIEDTNDLQTSNESIAQKNKDVNILRELRTMYNIPTDEIVKSVQKLHPKYDKTLQSKCEHTDEYGVCLEPNAMNMLIDTIAKLPSTTVKKVRKDNHRLTARAECRVEKDVKVAFIKKLQADGFNTMQGCLYFLIKAYIGGDI